MRRLVALTAAATICLASSSCLPGEPRGRVHNGLSMSQGPVGTWIGASDSLQVVVTAAPDSTVAVRGWLLGYVRCRNGVLQSMPVTFSDQVRLQPLIVPSAGDYTVRDTPDSLHVETKWILVGSDERTFGRFTVVMHVSDHASGACNDDTTTISGSVQRLTRIK